MNLKKTKKTNDLNKKKKAIRLPNSGLKNTKTVRERVEFGVEQD